MIDIQVRRAIDPILDRIAMVLVRVGLTANSVTWIGFILGLLGAASVAMDSYFIGFVCIALNRLCDGLDGCIARRTSKTDLGGFLDIALDMIFYASIPFGFAVSETVNALPAAYLMFSFFGTGTSFLAFAIISGKRGRVEDNEGKKSFFYSVGLIEGTETAVFLLVTCLMPAYFPLLAWVFGTLCWVTTTIRVISAHYAFSGNSLTP